MGEQGMWALIRFRVTNAHQFRAGAEAVVTHWRGSEGCRQACLVRNVDDPGLWSIITHWDDVGSYRRSFSGYEAKMLLTPLLSQALDEPSAYLPPDEASGGFLVQDEGSAY